MPTKYVTEKSWFGPHVVAFVQAVAGWSLLKVRRPPLVMSSRPGVVEMAPLSFIAGTTKEIVVVSGRANESTAVFDVKVVLEVPELAFTDVILRLTQSPIRL